SPNEPAAVPFRPRRPRRRLPSFRVASEAIGYNSSVPSRLRFLPSAAALALALAFFAGTGAAFALPPLAVTGTLGVQTSPDFEGSGFGCNIGVYNRFDGQVLLGVQSGQGLAGHPTSVPVLAAGIMRLPFGRVFVPAASGGIGYAF